MLKFRHSVKLDIPWNTICFGILWGALSNGWVTAPTPPAHVVEIRWRVQLCRALDRPAFSHLHPWNPHEPYRGLSPSVLGGLFLPVCKEGSSRICQKNTTRFDNPEFSSESMDLPVKSRVCQRLAHGLEIPPKPSLSKRSPRSGTEASTHQSMPLNRVSDALS